MSRIILFGAEGFIGTAVSNKFSSLGYEVVRYAKSQSRDSSVKVLDLLIDHPSEQDLVGAECVIYCAGLAHETNNASERSKYLRLNAEAPMQIYTLCSQMNVKKFLYLSSVKAAIYDKHNNANQKTENIYAYSKREAELQLLERAKNSNTALFIVRPALVYGPKVKGNLALFKKMARLNLPLPLPKTNNRKSMVHLDDLVDSLWFMISRPELEKQIWVVAEPSTYTVMQIYKQICFSQGKHALCFYVPYKILKAVTSMIPGLKWMFLKLVANDVHPSRLIDHGFKFRRTVADIDRSEYC